MMDKDWPVVKIKFGTLSDYFNAIYKKHKIAPGDPPPNIPSLSGDFFTYADRDDHYWSGYYTSRPFQKVLDREMEHQLRGAEILFFLVSRYLKIHDGSKFPLIEFMQSLVNARRNLALFQHHDGITGTSKDVVVDDYGDRGKAFLESTAAKRVWSRMAKDVGYSQL
ncbi:alpha-mannosidase 2x-like [Octopus vulgaris]|uniref:mannosyl-oligosaccharide 1,3-1,6-alpha-mannosidase n=1 Tax=Octopus vulgaris TaxID=6645 RepID=A0AA36BTL6_OCTVU|nr:alpha-mannosidase 2x-like [Octopus vulgaris]